MELNKSTQQPNTVPTGVGGDDYRSITEKAHQYDRLMADLKKLVWDIYAEYDRVPQTLVVDEKFIISAVKTHTRQRMAKYDLNTRRNADMKTVTELKKTPEGKALLEKLLREAAQGRR